MLRTILGLSSADPEERAHAETVREAFAKMTTATKQTDTKRYDTKSDGMGGFLITDTQSGQAVQRIGADGTTVDMRPTAKAGSAPKPKQPVRFVTPYDTFAAEITAQRKREGAPALAGDELKKAVKNRQDKQRNEGAIDG